MPPSRHKQKSLGLSPSAIMPSEIVDTRKAQRRQLPDPYSIMPPGRGDYSGAVTFRAAMRWMLLRVAVILVSKEHRLENRPSKVLCPACDRLYRNHTSELVRHAFAHLPEHLRPLPCSLPADLSNGCKRRFAQASDRAAHEVTHFEDKGLPVPEERRTRCGVSVGGVICTETFNSPSAASRHRKKQHEPTDDQVARTPARPGIRGSADDALKLLHRYFEQGGWREAFDGNLRDGFGPLGRGDEDLPKAVHGSRHIRQFFCSPEQASASDERTPFANGHDGPEGNSLHWIPATTADFGQAATPAASSASTPLSSTRSFHLGSTSTERVSRSTSPCYESATSPYPSPMSPPRTPPSSQDGLSPHFVTVPTLPPCRARDAPALACDSIPHLIAKSQASSQNLREDGCRYDPPMCPWPPASPESPPPAQLADPATIRRVPTPPWKVLPSIQPQPGAEMLNEPVESVFEQHLAAQEARVEEALALVHRQLDSPTMYKPAFSFA